MEQSSLDSVIQIGEVIWTLDVQLPSLRFFCAHATIIWLNKLQTIMVLSTTKAKYVATSQATHEAI
jgi:hypothetical protein